MDCFRLRQGFVGQVASLAMTEEHDFAISPRVSREFCWKTGRPRKKEGAGNAGCALHPRSRVQCVEDCAHEHTGQRRQSDIPCAMALRLTSCSPRRTALLPPSLAGLTASLTPAPRRQDHTSSPYASVPFVKAHPRPPHPAPRFVTIASAPLGGAGWAE